MSEEINPHKELMNGLKIIQAQNISILQKLENIVPTGNMTRKEVAEECRVSLGTVHNAMKSGRLPFIKIGSRTLFKRKDVERWRGEG